LLLMKVKWINIIAVFGLISQLYLIYMAKVLGRAGFIFDSLIFIALIVIMVFIKDKINLTWPVAFMSVAYFYLHASGVFGYYGNSPFPVPFDWVVHYFGFTVLGMIFVQTYWDECDKLSVLCMIVLACMGIGAFVELMEYEGYLHLGEGEGALFYGPGDVNTDLMNEAGGGWINTMQDLVNNFFGTLTGMAIMLLWRFEKNYRT